MEYNISAFFKEGTVYTFLSPFGREFESEVENYNGAWFTTNKTFCAYKATSLKSKLNESN
jgi:hypothetical protein